MYVSGVLIVLRIDRVAHRTVVNITKCLTVWEYALDSLYGRSCQRTLFLFYDPIHCILQRVLAHSEDMLTVPLKRPNLLFKAPYSEFTPVYFKASFNIIRGLLVVISCDGHPCSVRDY